MNPLNQPVKKWLPTILGALAAILGENHDTVANFIAAHPQASLIAGWLVYQIGHLLPSPVTENPVPPKGA